MQLKIHPLKLALKRPFTIAHGTFHHREAVVVELQRGDFSGFGEATAISYYGKDQATFIAVLEQHRALIEASSFGHPSELYQQLLPIFNQHPFLLCALDVAAHDLWAKGLDLPLYQALGLSTAQLPLSNFTIGMDSLEDMVAQINEYDLPIYKIKVGATHAIERLQALRQHTTALFRIDANCAWTAAQTLEYVPQLQALGVEFIEQPLAKDNWAGMQQVFAHSALPVIADESCQVLADVERCHTYFHGVNIKLMKCGGITPALQMIQTARQLGMQVMLGCMTETSIGISAIAHLAPLLDYVDMDGAMLLQADPAVGAYTEKGKIIYGEGNGLGARLVNSSLVD